jgi:hypothetical protein
MALNLVRNSRVFFTTNVNGDGVVTKTGITSSNTFEIQVLDGFSFSQNTTSETVTLNEAGSAPSRGQRSFNTSLDPVEFSFSTYIRPKFDAGTGTAGDEFVKCEEEVLWNAFAGTGAIGGAGAGWTRTVSASPVSTLAFGNSNAHQLQKFGMLIWVDNVLFTIDNCALDQATIDFGLDGIATIAWTGRGTKLSIFEQTTLSAANLFGGTDGFSGTAGIKDTAAKYLANKLSTCVMVKGIDGSGATSHTIPITGGSITFANNLTYLTPANLGQVNLPITYFTGTRAVSGSINAYLRTGETNSSSDILSDILSNAATSQAQAYEITLNIGGTAAAGTRVELNLPAAVLSVPTINAEQVVSTTINFVAHGFSGSNYDITGTNEATLKYYAVA